jgi:acyl-CoA thioesterase
VPAVTTPNILTDTTPLLDPDRPTVARAVITDAWGLYFAQGGVVMAAALRAMGLVLARDDLALASASATFCRPVACGPVETEVTVLRSGRRGAQVLGAVRAEDASEREVSVALTGVFTDPALPGPAVTPLPRPVELHSPPQVARGEAAIENEYPLGFLDNTEWQVAAEPPEVPAPGELPRLATWFRFRSPPAPPGDPWNPALLPIPGDSLGSALVVALGGGDTPVGSVSLQIDVQVHAPIVGDWIGIDSTCTHVGGGLANGVLHLWSEAGTHVATVTQTAMLRSLV